MAKVYTKTGDKGETSLVSGNRVPKGNVRIDTYGEVDELNSYLGLIVTHISEKDVLSKEVEVFHTIQNNLFNLGSNLACEKEYREKYQLPNLASENVSYLEQQIDRYNEDLESLKNFILPGGSIEASHAHVARTICRRVERKMVNYQYNFPNEIPDFAIEYINRLSDFLFVFARYANKKFNKKDILWKIK